jgi:hypothetical protein
MPPSTSFELPLAEPLAEDARTSSAASRTRRRVRDDRGRPLDGVDLRHQRRVTAAPSRRARRPSSRVLRCEPVADRVVLAREERVQEREPEPEVPGDAREVELASSRAAAGRPGRAQLPGSPQRSARANAGSLP